MTDLFAPLEPEPPVGRPPEPSSPPPADRAASEPVERDAARDDADRFAARLHALGLAAQGGGSEARASLARLRRALGRRGVEPRALAEVGGALPTDLSSDEMDVYLLVGALYALQAAGAGERRGAREGTSLGGSCRWLRRELGVGQGSLDRRFGALLDARREDLPYRLRQVFGLMAAQAVGVRYDQLLRDLLAWERPGRPVQRRWAEHYWAPARTS